MKRRFLIVALSVLLLIASIAAPLSASAAGRTKVKILRVTEEGARVRSGPSSAYEVITSVKKGSRVFYLGKTTDSFAYVRTGKGVVGYMYKGFLKSYGTAYKDQIYYCNKNSAKVCKKPSSSSGRVATLSKNSHVIVYSVSGKWAYIKTLGGKGGYVRKSALTKAM